MVGPKPKRRTELGLLVFASLLTVALYVIAELGAKSKIPANIGPFLGVVPEQARLPVDLTGLGDAFGATEPAAGTSG